ncbi:MAG: hypothetical protein JOZ39_09345 [Chloroflexi bacterium]|nr:hypothetical protein [Chloroflexota bacterium]
MKDEQPGRVAGDSGNRYENVKSVERDAQGNVLRQPGDVRPATDDVAQANEAAREQGEV